MKTTVKIISNPQKEYEHQLNIISWSMLHRDEFPDLKFLTHIKNEEKSGAKEVAIYKALGVKKGFPDLQLPVPRPSPEKPGKWYGGLFIELKTEKGRATPEQKWWIENLNDAGNYAQICHGWESAVRVLEWYLSLRRSDDAPT